MPHFENRTRFNWGYHDAALAVSQGWDTSANNFGFAHHGPLAGLQNPEDILNRHFDKTYARGWFMGYCDAKMGNRNDSSEKAWFAALENSLVIA